MRAHLQTSWPTAVRCPEPVKRLQRADKVAAVLDHFTIGRKSHLEQPLKHRLVGRPVQHLSELFHRYQTDGLALPAIAAGEPPIRLAR